MNFDALPELQTDRLLLRPVRHTDAEDIFAFTSLPQTSEWLTWSPHPSLSHTEQFVAGVIEKYRTNAPAQWAVELLEERRVIGLCGFVDYSREDQKGEVAYVLSPAYWGRGFLTEALTAVIECAFAQGDVRRVQAKCEDGNVASERVMQKCGMSFEGAAHFFMKRKGHLRDYRFYAITR